MVHQVGFRAVASLRRCLCSLARSFQEFPAPSPLLDAFSNRQPGDSWRTRSTRRRTHESTDIRLKAQPCFYTNPAARALCASCPLSSRSTRIPRQIARSCSVSRHHAARSTFSMCCAGCLPVWLHRLPPRSDLAPRRPHPNRTACSSTSRSTPSALRLGLASHSAPKHSFSPQLLRRLSMLFSRSLDLPPEVPCRLPPRRCSAASSCRPAQPRLASCPGLPA